MNKVATLVLALAASAGVILALGSRAEPARAERAREFHGLVGGLGFGPAADAAACEFAFDPRLAPACSWDCGHVPGGLYFCPHHCR